MYNTGNPLSALRQARASAYNNSTPNRSVEFTRNDYRDLYNTEDYTPAITPREQWREMYGIDKILDQSSPEHPFLDTYRTIVKKLAEGKKNNDERDIYNIQDELAAAERVKKYAQNYDKLKLLQDELSDYSKRENADTSEIQRRINEINNLKANLQQEEEWFKTDGRKYDVVIENMYNKYTNSFADEFSTNITRGNFDNFKTYNDPIFGKSANPLSLGNWAKFGLNIINGIANGVTDAIGLITEPDYYSKTALKNYKNGDPAIDAAFKRPTTGNNTADKYIGIDLNRLEDAKEAYLEDLDFYQNGNLKPLKWSRGLLSYVNPDIDYSVNISNPDEIDPEYTKQQEEYAGKPWDAPGALGPLYTFAEIGSSLSLIEGMLGTIGTDKTFSYLQRKLPALILENTAGKGAQALRFGLNAANLVSQLGMTRYARALETSQEAQDAYTGRVLQTMNDELGQDEKNSILDQMKEQLQSNGISTKGLKNNEIIGAGLAFGIQVDDPRFYKISQDAKKGLNKLINQNNALAYSDYIETLPFLSQGGAITRQFGKLTSNLPNAFAKSKAGQILGRKALSDEAIRTAELAHRSRIDKAAQFFIKKDMPAAALKFKATAEALSRAGKRAASIMAIEGLEEGDQHLLQKRYERGQYDDYQDPIYAFNIPDSFRDIALYKDAIGGFLGINYGDPDNNSEELRKAMVIGAALGPVFSGIGTIASNITPGQNAGIRNLIQDYKTSNALKTLFGETYGQMQDEEHIGIFYDALNRAGVSRESLNRNLQRYRDLVRTSKNQDISPDFVDRDIELMHQTADLYEDEDFNKFLHDRFKIDKGTDKHRRAIQIGARIVTDLIEGQSNQAELNREGNRLGNQIDYIIDTAIDDEHNNSDDQLSSDEIKSVRNYITSYANQMYDKYTGQFERWNNKKREKESWKYQFSSARKLAEDKEFLEASGLAALYPMYDVITPEDRAINYERLIKQDKSRWVNAALDSKYNTQEPISKRDFIKRLYGIKVKELRLQELLRSRQEWADRSVLNKAISKLLGIDLNLETAESILEQFDNHIDALSKDIKQQAKPYVYKENEGDEEVKLSQILQNINVPFEDELRKSFQRIDLQNALIPVVSKRAIPFLFNRKSKDDVFYMTSIQEAINKNIDDASEQFAKELDKDDLRRRIAHRKYLDDMASDGEIVDRIENGDTEAEQAVQDAANGVESGSSIVQSDPDIQSEHEQRRASRDNSQPQPNPAVRTRDEENNNQSGEPMSIEDALDGNPEPINDENSNETSNQNEDQVEQRSNDANNEQTNAEDERDNAVESTNNIADILTGISIEQNGDAVVYNGVKCIINVDQSGENLTVTLTNAETGNPELMFVPDGYVIDNGALNNGQFNGVSITPDDLSFYALDPDGGVLAHLKPEEPNSNENAGININNADQEDKNVEDYSNLEDGVNLNNDDEVQNDGEFVNSNLQNDSEEVVDVSKNTDDQEKSVNVGDDVDDGMFIQLDPVEDEAEVAAKLLDNSDYIDPNDAILSKDKKDVTSSTTAKEKYIETTFFYQPDTDEPIVLKIHGEPVKFKSGYTIKPGSALGKKLAIRGWINSKDVDTYYIITSPIEKSDDNDPDKLTVVLVIEDKSDKSIYLSAMRTIEDAYEDMLNIGVQEYRDEDYRKQLELTVSSYYRTKSNEPGASRGLPAGGAERRKYLAKAMGWYKGLKDYKLKDEIDDFVRNIMYNDTVLSISKTIRPKIQALRNVRNEIINACLTKVDGKYVVNKDQAISDRRVRPSNLSISNGKFNNSGNFENLNRENNIFGFGSTVESIQEVIDSGAYHFGVGRGKHSQYKITDIYDDSIEYYGVGVGGKIFITIDGNQTSNIPMMLWEQRFNRQYKRDGKQSKRIKVDNPNSVSLEIDPQTGMASTVSKNLPSAAEAILYLICNKVSATELPDRQSNINVINALKEIFFHEVSYKEKPYDAADITVRDKEFYFVDSYDGGTLHVRIDGRPKQYHITELFANTQEAEQNRKELVLHIAKNIHYNTELNQGSITESLHKNYGALSDSLKQYFKDNPDAKSYSLFGIPELTFYKEDLFDENLNPKENISLLAMMIKNGKLITNTDVTDPFYAPFVYANGVKQSTTQDLINQDGGVSQDEANEIFETQSLSIKNKKLKELIDNKYLKSQADLQGIFDLLNETPGPKSHGGIKDIVVFNVDYSDNVEEQIKKSISARGLKVNQIDGIQQGLKSTDIVIGYVYNDGQVYVSKQNYKLVKNKLQGFTQVYSKHKSGGRVNVSRTKKWIREKLGISEHDVITDAILFETSDETVYGVTRVACDILNRATVQIGINSSAAGRGVGYHEAWHYVNLLIHTKQQRAKIYDEYRRLNPDVASYSDKAIEEMLAEDFRVWAEIQNENNITNVIKRVWNKFLKFIRLNKNNAITEIFYRIQNGDYAGQSIDKASLNEFRRAYNDVVYSMDYYPGVPKKELQKLKVVNDPVTYSQVRDAIVNGIMSYFNLSSIANIKNQTDRFFDDYIKHLKNKLEVEFDPMKASIMKDVVDHPLAFKTAIIRKFEEFGLRPKLRLNQQKSTKQELQESLDYDSNDQNENVWDRDGFDIARSENIRLGAKLFLSSVPVLVYDQETQSYSVQEDPILGEPVTYGFKESFNIAIRELWNCDSFEDEVETEDSTTALSPTSMRHKINILAKAGNAYFVALKEKIDELEEDEVDENVKTQLFGALASQMSNIAYVGLKDKENSNAVSQEVIDLTDSTGQHSQEKIKVVDTKRYIDVSTDNYISAEYITLGQWGSNFAQGEFVRNGKVVTGKTSRIKEQSEKLSKELKRLKKYINQGKIKSTDDELVEKVIGLKLQFVDLANNIGIPLDITSLTGFLSNFRLNKNGEKYNQDDTLNEIFSLDGAFSGLYKIIKQICGSSQKVINEPISVFKIRSNVRYMKKMARSYLDTNPSSIEFSQIDPDGKRIYGYGDNNQFSDMLRRYSSNHEKIVDAMMKSAYCANSEWLNLFKNGAVGIKVLHRGLKDYDSKDGTTYLRMSDLEDYICKLKYTFGNIRTVEIDGKNTEVATGWFVSPTMADKKSFFGLQFRKPDRTSAINTPHELIVDGKISTKVLGTFLKYFESEVLALKEYYSEENINALIKNPNKLIKNYHGKIKDGKLQFGGNGGLMRYFANAMNFKVGNDKDGATLNINEYLQFLHQREVAQNRVSDGYEDVRQEIDAILNSDPQDIMDSINDMIIGMIRNELNELSKSPTKKVVDAVDGEYSNIAIPVQILKYYTKLSNRSDVKSFSSSDAIFTAIGNHLMTEMMSVIEFEKLYSGDPAFYKRYSSQNGGKTFVENGVKYKVDGLIEKYSDKIKRLGSLLSPGQNIRTDFSDTMRDALGIRRGNKYTVLNMGDYKTKSEYIDSHVVPRMTKQYIVNILRSNPDQLNIPASQVAKTISDVYKFDGTQEQLFDKFDIPQDLREKTKEFVDSQAKPYQDINVSDAQTIIRPQFYRELRIRLGMWQFEPIRLNYIDENGNKQTTQYTDDKAFDLLETDPGWMNDAEKTAIVNNFEHQALKMTYFDNTPTQISENVSINTPLYNKMAVFTLFRWQAGSDIGNALYKRMNKPGQEIDMLAFESAVKVGLEQQIYFPYGKDGKTFNFKDLDKNSSRRLNRNGDVEESNVVGGLNVRIQDINNLRLQLNTESHEADERSLGSQSAKLALANIFDDDVLDATAHAESITGRQYKDEMLTIYRRLIQLKTSNIQNRFSNDQNVRKFLESVAISNNLDDNIIDAIKSGAPVASMQQREIFEQSVISMLTKSIIDFTTKGGTAIQQSEFGFAGKHSDSPYESLNDGQSLQWNTKDNSMEVMLSMNFFRDVIPESEQVTFSRAKQWLIDHDIIKGTKSDGTKSDPSPIGFGYRVPTQGQSSMFSFTVADVMPSSSGDLIIVPKEFTAQTGSDYDVDKIYLSMLKFDKDGNVITQDTEGSEIDYLVNQYIIRTMQMLQSSCMYASTHASIDVIVNKIKSEIVPLVKESQPYYDLENCELTPFFQSERRREFTAGKQGVAIFALAIVNTAQTQSNNVRLASSRTDGFGLLPLDTVLSIDGTYVLDYLSALLSSEVDVAKDPYVFDININDATYDILCYIIRSGAGIGGITFISQPAIKELANRLLSVNSIYGNNVGKFKSANYSDMSKSKRFRQNVLDVIKTYKQMLIGTINEQGLSKNLDKNRASELKYFISDIETTDKKFPEVFDYDLGIQALKDPSSIDSILFQLKCLSMFKQMKNNSDTLAELVQKSRIDTKKFGNTIAKQLNWVHGWEELVNSFQKRRAWTCGFVEDENRAAQENQGAEKRVAQVRFSRNNAESDVESLYIFTDNTDRTSGSKPISEDSPYSKKYGKHLKYPTQTQAVLRGLPNAMPISTQRWIFDHGKGKPSKANPGPGQWTDEDFEEFKKVITGEIDDIISEWNTGKYTTLKIGTGDAILNGSISEITEERVPKLYEFLKSELDRLMSTIFGDQVTFDSVLENSSDDEQFEQQVDGRSVGLEDYFENSGLKQMLFGVTGLARQIFRYQSFSASSMFEQMFNRIMAEKNGTYLLYDKSSVGVKADFDEEYVSNLSRIIDDILRYISLIQFGNFHYNVDGENIISASDNIATDSYYKLIDPNSDSNIFRRLEEIQKDGELGKLPSDIHDGEVMTNRLLKQLYVEKTDAGEQIQLTRSIMDMTQSQLNEVTADFYQILNHVDNRIRHFAQDLVKYFYFQYYDGINRNNKFGIVPAYAKSQYIQSINDALINGFEAEFSIEEILDVLFRNSYQDEKLVPTVDDVEGTSGNQTSIDKITQTHTLYNIKLGRGSRRLPGIILSKYYTGPFIKIKRKSDLYLYKKIGDIKKTSTQDENKSWNISIYAIFPKAGIDVNGRHVNEYDVIQKVPSQYQENDLPQQFAPGVFDPEFIVSEFIANHSKDFSYEIDIRNGLDAVQFNYSSPDQYTKGEADKIFGGGNVAVEIKKDESTEWHGVKLRNVRRVEFGKEEDAAKWDKGSRKVNVSNNIDVKTIVDNMNLKADTSIVLYMFGDITISENSKEEIDNYIKDQMARVSDANLTEQQLSQHKNFVESIADKMVTEKKKQDVITDILSEIRNRGVYVNQVFTTHGQGIAAPTMRAVMDMAYEDPTYFGDNTIPGWMYVGKEFYQNGKNQEYFDFFNENIIFDYYDALTDEEASEQDVAQEVAKSINNAVVSDVAAEQAVESNIQQSQQAQESADNAGSQASDIMSVLQGVDFNALAQQSLEVGGIDIINKDNLDRMDTFDDQPETKC